MSDNKEKQGKFIVIEGCDNSGKSTIIKSLKEIYKNNNNIVFVKEPNFTDFGNSITKVLKKFDLSADIKLHLFTAARLDLINNVIIPALKEGKTVISERFALSTWVYQCSENNELLKIVKPILDSISEKCNVDVTVFIRATIAELTDLTDSNAVEKTSSLLLWYNMGLLGQEFPKALLGNIVTLDFNNSLEEKIKSIKTLINNKNNDCNNS